MAFFSSVYFTIFLVFFFFNDTIGAPIHQLYNRFFPHLPLKINFSCLSNFVNSSFLKIFSSVSDY